MKIALTIPSFTPHGGTRVIMEWANRLSSMGHTVGLYCARHSARPRWFALNAEIPILSKPRDLSAYKRWVISSPHDIGLAEIAPGNVRVTLFLQMLEHLFRPEDLRWQKQCEAFYGSSLPMITIACWIKKELQKAYPDRGPIHLVGNGVNLEDFPLEPSCKKDPATVLVEGWNPLNPTKDVDRLGPKVARVLRTRGYTVLAYSQTPLNDYMDAASEYYCRPSLEVMNCLYRRANILIKATRCDARSCSPMEAMTKGTVTARAIDCGDDDLSSWFNCVKVPYDFTALMNAVDTLTDNREIWENLSRNCLQYVSGNSWDRWMPVIEGLLC